MKKLEALKKGDKIIIEYGHEIRNAIVLVNFHKHKKIYISVNIGFFGLLRTKVIKDYDDYNFWTLQD